MYIYNVIRFAWREHDARVFPARRGARVFFNIPTRIYLAVSGGEKTVIEI